MLGGYINTSMWRVAPQQKYMKVTIQTYKRIAVKENNLDLSMTWDGKELSYFDSSLPYKKSVKDWDFYSRAISAILKKI